MWIPLLVFTTRDAGAAPPDRIVAVGDLHGDLGNAVRVLQLAGVVDKRGAWSGGPTVLVQTGDTTDRGPDSKAIMDLLKNLESQAHRAGGKVIPLLGNHEVMNLHQDLRYVHPGDTVAFGGEAARRQAFSPTGTYGSWLATLDAVTIVGDTVFAHGGVRATWAALGVDTINARVRSALFVAPQAAVLDVDGPLWYRGYVEESESVACPELQKALAALSLRRMVVGHTTRRDGRIQGRCDGRLHVIDTGIASAYGGHLAAWQSTNGDAAALYPTGTEDLRDPPL